MWRQLIEKKKNIILTNETLENKEKDFEIVKLKYGSGTISDIEKEKATLEIQKSRNKLLLNNYEYIVMHANLDYFCGRDVGWIKELSKQN